MMNKENHPDTSIHDIDTCTDEITSFMDRATQGTVELNGEHKDKSDVLINFVRAALAKQQLFGILTKEGDYTQATDTPTLLEYKLMEHNMNTAGAQIALILDMYKLNPEGTIIDGGPEVQIGNDMNELETVKFNVIDDLILKAGIGSYMLKLHNLLTSPEEKEFLMEKLRKSMDITEEGVELVENVNGEKIMSDLIEEGMTDFFANPIKLKNALVAHTDGTKTIEEALFDNKPEDMHEVDAAIKIKKLLELLQPLLEIADHIDIE